jgi:hypothetical protein
LLQLSPTMELKTLTAAEVLEVHNALVKDFSSSSDPISPPGMRSMDLLESAVARQHTGIGDVLNTPMLCLTPRHCFTESAPIIPSTTETSGQRLWLPKFTLIDIGLRCMTQRKMIYTN